VLNKKEQKKLQDLEYTFSKNLVEKFDVVISTCCGCGNRIMLHQHFEIVIIDEAGQETEPMVLLAILRANLYPNVSHDS